MSFFRNQPNTTLKMMSDSEKLYSEIYEIYRSKHPNLKLLPNNIMTLRREHLNIDLIPHFQRDEGIDGEDVLSKIKEMGDTEYIIWTNRAAFYTDDFETLYQYLKYEDENSDGFEPMYVFGVNTEKVIQFFENDYILANY
jgi:hypothetical protein